ncbi:MAG: ABC transporter substrate-binding protein [Spirochaeta sp.]|jgi:putative spermidine/putrescine transport system substrate-binding protein|nr:ABC transporter substrate-binding protein [Spirochaeta sp.]
MWRPATAGSTIPAKFLWLLLIVVAAAVSTPEDAHAGGRNETATETAGVDPLSASWEDILAAARGSEVRMYMWGGSETVNGWIDGYVTTELAEEYGLELVRVPMDAAVFVNKLLTEKQARTERGTIDILWINGENFRNAREADLLTGPITDLLPNFTAYVDADSAAYDAGFPTDGYEAPWGRAQFNFDVDTARVPDPPRSFAELAEWVRENPGRFTYPQPPDFTGSAFVRQAFYALTGGYEQYQDRFDAELFERNAPVLWEYLNDIAPYLWQAGESYPRDLATLDSLFERGAVDFTMSFTQTSAATRIANGRYPESVRSLVFRDGSLYNTHFLAVPFNAPNVAGALVVINFLLSPEAQFAKNRLKNWGDFTVLALDRLSPEQQQQFTDLDLGAATVPLEELDATGVPEIPSEYWEALEDGWNAEVRLRR